MTGLVVLAGGVAAGYYFIGGRNDNSGNVSSTLPPAPTAPVENSSSGNTSAHAVVKHIASAAGQFTAPGAPSIEIDETKVTPPKPVAAPALPPMPADTEASQTGAASDAGSVPDSSSTSDTPSDSGATDSTAANSSTTSSQSTSSAAPTDATNGTGANDTANSAPDSVNANNETNTTGGTAGTNGSGTTPPINSNLYHVVAGVVHSESNAKSIESALRHKGYTATILHQTNSSGDTYTVQIGAYSSQVTADEMVSSLEHDGFPASVTSGH